MLVKGLNKLSEIGKNKEEEKPEEENTESTEASVESENASVEEFVLETETKFETEAPEVTEE